jgi:hypothetical protein
VHAVAAIEDHVSVALSPAWIMAALKEAGNSISAIDRGWIGKCMLRTQFDESLWEA